MSARKIIFDDQPGAMIGTIVREGARIMTAITVIVAALWMLGKPALIGVINDYAKEQQFVTQSEIVVLKQHVNDAKGEIKDLQKDNHVTDTAIIEVQTKINNIENLLKEQQGDIKQLLRNLKGSG